MDKTVDLAALREKFAIADPQKGLIYRVDSGKGGRYKAGTRAGSVMRRGTRIVQLDGTYLLEHQVVWALHYGEWPKGDIRHLNGDCQDNRISNLGKAHRGWHSHTIDSPDLDRLQELFRCDFRTGKLFWRTSPRFNVETGSEAGFRSSSGYLTVIFDGRRTRVHHIVWALQHGEWPRSEIDHINGIRHDNRLNNLRLATRSENSQNMALRSDNKTGRTGVHQRKDNGKYMANIQVNRKVIALGCYSTFEEAVAAREIAEKKYHPFNNPARNLFNRKK